jgi:GntR family transcriptional regulator, transcriptional repressor for pyruvate dehydrogenase complex
MDNRGTTTARIMITNRQEPAALRYRGSMADARRKAHTAAGDHADPGETGDGRALWNVEQPRSGIERGVKTSERVASAIVDDIVAAGLKPGDRLPNEAAMIDRFRVGRGTLREALRILEVYGLINLRSGPGGGPVVVAIDPRSVSRTFSLYLHLSAATMGELIETRLLIEPMVARFAAMHIDEADNADRLRDALRHEQSISAEGGRYIDAANDFHYVLASVTGNRVFDVVATALKELYTTRIVGGGLASQTTEPNIRFEHQEIGEAILAGNADQAETLMRDHMDLYIRRLSAVNPNFAKSVIDWS